MSTIEQELNEDKRQTIIIQQQPRKSNGMGVAGFVLSLIAMFIGWIPLIGWALWFLGFIFSFIGIFKKPSGLAVAGLIISLVTVVVMVLLVIVGGVTHFSLSM